jgi:cytochrome P450
MRALATGASQMAPIFPELDKLVPKIEFDLEKLLEKAQDNPMQLVAVAGTSVALGMYMVHLISHTCKQTFGESPLPPGPSPFPLIGSLHKVIANFGWDGNPRIHIGLHKLAKKYGPVYGLWMGNYYTVVISSPEIAHATFNKNGKFTSDRAYLQSQGGDHVPSMYIATRNGQGIAMSHGSYWRKVRTALEANISRAAPAERNAPIVLREVQSVVCVFREMSKRGEALTTLTAQLKRESLNVGTQLLFSMRYGAHCPEDFMRLQGYVEFFFKNLSSGNPGDMIPVFRVFPAPGLIEMQKQVKERDELLERMINGHKDEYLRLKSQGKMQSRADCRDLVDQFFYDADEGKLSEDQIHVCVWDILFAMTDTTATTNEWMIYYMINYPDVQKKVHAELDRVLGTERLPTLGDREKLPYFWAVVKEVMRIRMVSPILAPHYCSEEITIPGGNGKTHTLPAGTQIFMHAWAMAMDETLWDKPEEFNPDRWFSERNAGLDLHGKEKRGSIEHFKFIPFSMGPRTCPGYSFAKVSVFMQAATIMQCFEWKLTDAGKNSPYVKDGKLDMTENWGLTVMPQRYGDMGLIAANPRKAAELANFQDGDIWE